MKFILLAFLLALGVNVAEHATVERHADKFASLIDPANLATLDPRGPYQRVQKAVV